MVMKCGEPVASCDENAFMAAACKSLSIGASTSFKKCMGAQAELYVGNRGFMVRCGVSASTHAQIGPIGIGFSFGPGFSLGWKVSNWNELEANIWVLSLKLGGAKTCGKSDVGILGVTFDWGPGKWSSPQLQPTVQVGASADFSAAAAIPGCHKIGVKFEAAIKIAIDSRKHTSVEGLIQAATDDTVHEKVHSLHVAM